MRSSKGSSVCSTWQQSEDSFFNLDTLTARCVKSGNPLKMRRRYLLHCHAVMKCGAFSFFGQRSVCSDLQHMSSSFVLSLPSMHTTSSADSCLTSLTGFVTSSASISSPQLSSGGTLRYPFSSSSSTPARHRASVANLQMYVAVLLHGTALRLAMVPLVSIVTQFSVRSLNISSWIPQNPESSFRSGNESSSRAKLRHRPAICQRRPDLPEKQAHGCL